MCLFECMLRQSLNDGLNRMKSAVSNVYVRVRDRRTENISKLSAEVKGTDTTLVVP